MNTTDEALILFRKLRAMNAPGRLRYRAYLRWKRRDAKLTGTIRPSIDFGGVYRGAGRAVGGE